MKVCDGRIKHRLEVGCGRTIEARDGRCAKSRSVSETLTNDRFRSQASFLLISSCSSPVSFLFFSSSLRDAPSFSLTHSLLFFSSCLFFSAVSTCRPSY